MYQMLGANDVLGGRSPLFSLPSGRGHARFRSIRAADDRHLQRQWLKGIGIGFACAGAFVALLSSADMRPHEATVQMAQKAPVTLAATSDRLPR
jgi:hypothetical protein